MSAKLSCKKVDTQRYFFPFYLILSVFKRYSHIHFVEKSKVLLLDIYLDDSQYQNIGSTPFLLTLFLFIISNLKKDMKVDFYVLYRLFYLFIYLVHSEVVTDHQLCTCITPYTGIQ